VAKEQTDGKKNITSTTHPYFAVHSPIQLMASISGVSGGNISIAWTDSKALNRLSMSQNRDWVPASNRDQKICSLLTLPFSNLTTQR